MSRVMNARALRPAIIAILLVVGAAGFYLGSVLQRTSGSLIGSQQDVAARLGRMTETAAEVGAAQEAYVAPGQPDEPWLARVSELVQQLSDSSAAIHPLLRSAQVPARMQGLSANLADLVEIDGRIRIHLRNGQDLSASDLIFTEARGALGRLGMALRAIAQDERAASDSRRASLQRQGWLLSTGVAVIWVAGLLLLARRPEPGSGPTEREVYLPQLEPLASLAAPAAPVVETVVETVVEPVALDLSAAAAVCTDISRLVTASALPDLLARASEVLDASGMILWMGAGEELFAVTAHGYDPNVMARLGPIGRHSHNATAAAWRGGEFLTVPGDAMSNGAIVAPLFGVDGCIGVLAAEIRHGRESDAATHAVTTMFAAQLATIVAAWPAPSEARSTASDEAGAGGRLAVSL